MKYVYHNILNNLFIIAFLLTCLLVSINYNIFFIVVIIFLIYIYLNDKTLFIISFIITIIVLLLYIIIYKYQMYLINNFEDYITGKIINIEQKQYYQKITLKYKIFKIIVRDYNFNNLELGMVIKVEGINLDIDCNHVFNGFNYNKYFYNNLYLYEIKSSSIKILKKQFSIYIFNDLVNNYLVNNFTDQSLVILKGFILGDTSGFSSSLNNELKINGIVHLFAISGLHVSLLISLLEKGLNNLKFKNYIINIVLIIYMIITRFAISILRSVLTYFLKLFFKNKNIIVSSINITSLIFILFVLTNPFIMYNNGFVLSFMATFIIILIPDSIKNKSKIKSILYITSIINIFTLPILINMNNEYNIISPIINVFMILLVESIILPFSFIIIFIPILGLIYSYVINSFLFINELFTNISIKLNCILIVKDISIFIIIIYYVLLIGIVVINKKKIKKILSIIFILFFILFILNINYYINPHITFLDLYKGESTLIEYKDETIIIDTGEGIDNELTTILKSKGIKKIDYLILTHDHSDHNGEAGQLINNFKVTNIVLSEYDNSVFSKMNNSIILKQKEVLKTKYFIFECIAPIKEDDNVNNRSLVLYAYINNITILFTGDMEYDLESEVNFKKIDILKVGHHGSFTSTSEKLLDQTNPKYAIIMCGRSNSFSFPSNYIVNRIKQRNIVLYNTKVNYSIELIIKKNKCIFNTIK